MQGVPYGSRAKGKQKQPLPPARVNKTTKPKSVLTESTVTSRKPVPIRKPITAAPETVFRVPPIEEARLASIEDEATYLRLEEYKKQQQDTEQANPYLVDASIYMPTSRRSYYKFIQDTYEKEFGKAFHIADEKIDTDACSNLKKAGAEQMKTFPYQNFIREYIRQASPYRGILVYHGLGSGKTCSAIAAAESLYGIANKHIVVMTPFSLRQNFINEISFCGFRHFQTNNHWVSQPLEGPYAATIRLYAKTVLSLNDEFLNEISKRQPGSRKVIWLPDFNKPSNFTTLLSQEQSDIRAQIQRTIENRITFINYNGVKSDTLKKLACDRDGSGNTIFDNAVIVVDEFHNLVRLMRGSILPYLAKSKKAGSTTPYEPITPDPWIPQLCKSGKYRRAFLFYRILCGARNSKIIALSGTPLINFPEELSILSNTLAGYTDCISVRLVTTNKEVLNAFSKIAKAEPRVDLVFADPDAGSYRILISIFPVGYVKVMDGDNFVGVKRALDEADQAEGAKTIQEIYKSIKDKVKQAAIPIGDDEQYVSYPRLPPDGETFKNTFIERDTSRVKNEIVLKKRLTGLFSYYKGSKEEYMPRVVKRETVECGMSDYVLGKYSEARSREIDIELQQKKEVGETGDVIAEIEAFAKKKNPSSYRFRSRAICNFAFPKGIERPFPENEQLVDAEIGEGEGEGEGVGAGAADIETQMNPEEDRIAEVAVAAEDAEIRAEEGEAVAVSEALPQEQTYTYMELIRRAMGELDRVRDDFLKLDGVSPETSLVNLSPKMAQILRNIMNSQGSNLLYSQFKTVEGLGVFGTIMKANDFTEIEILGSDADPYFSDETIASLKLGPHSRTKRFIYFTGEGSKARRNIILNIFNGNFDPLPQKIKGILTDKDTGYTDVKNMHGELCWVIGLTGAGAEGISLRNVRRVHIMEPYWNMVRLEQVEGRAIRICSHSDLPYDEREVESYTYYTAFSEDQITNRKIDQTIVNTDKLQTSDQKVLGVSKRKHQMNEELLTIMKETAVDCMFNLPDNGDISCFNIEGGSNQYMFHPDLNKDIRLTQSEFADTRRKKEVAALPEAEVVEGEISRPAEAARSQENRMQVVEIEREGVIRQYILKPDGHNLFKLFDMKDMQLRTPVGELKINPATGDFEEPKFYTGS